MSAVHLDDSQLVTLKLESGNYLRFQADTGAQCNVIPLSLYKKATKDFDLTQVIPAETQLTAYGSSTVPVVGRVLIPVWRGEFRCKLDCKLVDSTDIRPLLGRKACLGTKIVSYLDYDRINKPNTKNVAVFALEIERFKSERQIIEKYPV